MWESSKIEEVFTDCYKYLLRSHRWRFLVLGGLASLFVSPFVLRSSVSCARSEVGKSEIIIERTMHHTGAHHTQHPPFVMT